MHPVRRQVETEKLDGDEAVALGVESAKHRTERSGANLMQNPERSKRVRRRGAGSIRMQGKSPLEGGSS